LLFRVYLGFTRVSQTSRYGRNFQNFPILCREPDQGIGNTSLECTTFPTRWSLVKPGCPNCLRTSACLVSNMKTAISWISSTGSVLIDVMAKDPISHDQPAVVKSLFHALSEDQEKMPLQSIWRQADFFWEPILLNHPGWNIKPGHVVTPTILLLQVPILLL